MHTARRLIRNQKSTTLQLNHHWSSADHYSDVIMNMMASQITGVSSVCSTVCSGAGQKNIKAPRHWPLWGESTGHRWKRFHMMTSPCPLQKPRWLSFTKFQLWRDDCHGVPLSCGTVIYHMALGSMATLRNFSISDIKILAWCSGQLDG